MIFDKRMKNKSIDLEGKLIKYVIKVKLGCYSVSLLEVSTSILPQHELVTFGHINEFSNDKE